MSHIPLFFGPEAWHLQIRVIGYVISMAVLVLVVVGIEKASGNGARWPLRLLVWPLGAMTFTNLLIAELKTKELDLSDMLIYTVWFEVACLLAFWIMAQRRKH